MKTLYLFFACFVISMAAHCQEANVDSCNCDQINWKGKDGRSAYLGSEPFTGKCYSFFENGTVREERSYLNAQLEGESKSFYPNGKLKELTTYTVNLKNGDYFSYDEKGQLIRRTTYLNGQKQTEIEVAPVELNQAK
ncbi:toxin-antitoxin system YwqK family antitoxin [Mangrovibacterium lignilyticum]|uniref:toxin-antitoxin system YwqK family antitoxin n=1 Tax=Mangrovibacterium lignilyticum TaxID=2668052 RepID=UPI0013D37959|nr:hypothetical protein [Mangrovibacterium lignilyticum]